MTHLLLEPRERAAVQDVQRREGVAEAVKIEAGMALGIDKLRALLHSVQRAAREPLPTAAQDGRPADEGSPPRAGIHRLTPCGGNHLSGTLPATPGLTGLGVRADSRAC